MARLRERLSRKLRVRLKRRKQRTPLKRSRLAKGIHRVSSVMIIK